MIKRNRLEWLFFESVIVEINLENWDKYFQITLLAVWDKFENDVFPIYEFKKVYFKKVTQFGFELNPLSFDTEINQSQTRGLNISDMVFLKGRSNIELKINLEFNGHINIICDSFEIVDLEKNENDALKKKTY